MIHLRETLRLAHTALTEASVDHALIGGLALADLGINRATADVDLLADGEKRDQLILALKSVGFNLKQETPEVLHFEGKGWLDILLAQRPISRAMLGDAKVLGSSGVPCLGAEDIIGLKIQAYTNNPDRTLRDQADIQELIRIHQVLDWNKIERYAELFHQWDEIKKIRGK